MCLIRWVQATQRVLSPDQPFPTGPLEPSLSDQYTVSPFSFTGYLIFSQISQTPGTLETVQQISQSLESPITSDTNVMKQAGSRSRTLDLRARGPARYRLCRKSMLVRLVDFRSYKWVVTLHKAITLWVPKTLWAPGAWRQTFLIVPLISAIIIMISTIIWEYICTGLMRRWLEVTEVTVASREETSQVDYVLDRRLCKQTFKGCEEINARTWRGSKQSSVDLNWDLNADHIQRQLTSLEV